MHCDAKRANGAVCGQSAPYFCSSGHHLCSNHAVKLGGEHFRRKNDRKCAACNSRKISFAAPGDYGGPKRRAADEALLPAEDLIETHGIPAHRA